MIDIKNFTRRELKDILAEKSYPPYTAQQIFQWMYRRRVEDIAAMSNVSGSNRRRLAEEFTCSQAPIIRKQTSKDGTMKFLIGLESEETIETVLIPEGKRNTLCVSTQVGCSRGCSFCVSGTLGLRRNLSVSEMINQYLAVRDGIRPQPITNIVFMGIGEPLDNIDNLIKTIVVLQDSHGAAFTARKTCVSTIGITEGIARLTREPLRVRLSVSLHCADEKKRIKLMPATKKYPLAGLIPHLRLFVRTKKIPVTFEYILIDKFNCGDDDARALIRLVRRLPCKINLIPYNRSEHFLHMPPSHEAIVRFQNRLKTEGITCTLRASRGADIAAACGQLKAQFKTRNKK